MELNQKNLKNFSQQLKDPLMSEMLNDMLKDPSILEKMFDKTLIQKYPFFRFILGISITILY